MAHLGVVARSYLDKHLIFFMHLSRHVQTLGQWHHHLLPCTQDWADAKCTASSLEHVNGENASCAERACHDPGREMRCTCVVSRSARRHNQ